ncbi:MAG TPA: DUF1501 domain-containing protein [Burkholderiaceae bacterium]|nr:DUF1501 domain-containing protein [Burkholderiaceae bacterium]
MNRRRFLQSAAVGAACFSGWARAATRDAPPRLLVLFELRGGNDGLNTLVPVHDGRYRDLRPRLALAESDLVALAPNLHLHGSLAPWLPLWNTSEMAVLQGVGYPQSDLSHFRSIEIWDTASASSEIVQTGWLTRVAENAAAFRRCAADGVILGAADLGPFTGGARAIALSDVRRFTAMARLALTSTAPAQGALAHLLRVENEIVRAGTELGPVPAFSTEFPRTPLGQAVQQAAALGSSRRVPVIRVTLSGFDTHQNQLGVQANLLRQLAEGIVALRGALVEAGVWDDTLLLTYSEFGRRPRENGSGGTDHGTANVHFAFGRSIRGGVYGEPPPLDRLDANGNLQHTLDFRSIYAAIIADWWGLDASRALRGRFNPVRFIDARHA